MNNQTKLDSIVYTLPDTVNKLIVKYILSKSKKDMYFSIYKQKDHYIIFPSNIYKSDTRSVWVKKTNRVVFINGTFYPLVFGLDQNLACIEGVEEIKKFLLTNKYLIYTQNIEIYEGTYIEFNKDGSFVKEL